MWDYTDKVRDHFRNPRNVGAVEEPDGVGEVGSLACGDALRLTFKLDGEGRIADARFQTFGCASAIASSSALTEMIKGMTLEQAEKVTNQDIARYLGGLPEQKMHCSVMGKQALDAAIADYRGGARDASCGGRVVCTCFGVTQPEIERVIRENGLTTVEDVTDYCKAGGGCGGCREDIAGIVGRVGGKAGAVGASRADGGGTMTNIEKIRLIEETIEREIRPALQQDGGDIELIDVKDNRVVVAFRGSCAQCPVAGYTMKNVVERPLREFVADDLVVVEEVR